jgi:transposase-like protein
MVLQARLSKIEFQQKFSTEKACEQQLFQMKWPNGYRCEKCNCEHNSTITTRNLPLYQCNKCGYQATVIVNTILEKTRTPLVKWFIAIYWMATDKRGYSATQLARDIQVSYPTAWLMLHKIRESMRNRDDKYRLSGIIEIDESYFGGPDKGGKRGRGTKKQKSLLDYLMKQMVAQGLQKWKSLMMSKAKLFWNLQNTMLILVAKSTAMHIVHTML